MVEDYCGHKRLSTTSEKCIINEIDDIGPLSNNNNPTNACFAVEKLEIYNC